MLGQVQFYLRSIFQHYPLQSTNLGFLTFRPEGDTRYVPYDERLAQRLEGEYMRTVQSASWHRRLEIPVDETGRSEVFVFHNPQAMVHYRGLAQPADEYGITGKLLCYKFYFAFQIYVWSILYSQIPFSNQLQ